MTLNQPGNRSLIVAMTTFPTNLNLSMLKLFICNRRNQSIAESPRTWIPRKCVNHSHKFHSLVLLCQQGCHFVSNKPSEGVSAKKVRSMALLLADQLNVMCGKLTYSTPVLTHCCWVSKAQCIEGYQILISVKERCQYNTD